MPQELTDFTYQWLPITYILAAPKMASTTLSGPLYYYKKRSLSDDPKVENKLLHKLMNSHFSPEKYYTLQQY